MKYPFKSSKSKVKDPYMESSKVYLIDFYDKDSAKELFLPKLLQKILDDKTGDKFVFIEEPNVFLIKETGQYRYFTQGYWSN